jgi:hypothetical protein
MSSQPSFFKGWTEPESAANTAYPPDYGHNNVTASESGHTFEMDDSRNRERVRLAHRTGTFIEMHPNGDEVHKVYGNNFTITVKDNNVLIQGNCFVTIEGDSYMYVKGDKIEQVDGNYELYVKGNYTQVVEQTSNITTKNDMKILAGASLGGGALTLATSDAVYVESDLVVDGEVTALKVFSNGRVDATTGMSAGPLGFVTQTGGISVGFPSPGVAVAVPGQIMSIGNIISGMSVNALVGMNAPIGNFGTMSAVLMTDLINTAIYNTHIHPAPRGPTGLPSVPMV